MIESVEGATKEPFQAKPVRTAARRARAKADAALKTAAQRVRKVEVQAQEALMREKVEKAIKAAGSRARGAMRGAMQRTDPAETSAPAAPSKQRPRGLIAAFALVILAFLVSLVLA